MKRLTLPQPLPDDSVQAYLQPYGFLAASSRDWRSSVPALHIDAVGHSVMDGHTYYHLECRLEPVPDAVSGSGAKSVLAPVSWDCAARVHHLRNGLYKHVKQELGRSYESSFIETPFAHRMRPAGTTARLQAWCRQLGQLISARRLSPALVAAALRFLDAPRPGFASAGAPVINIVTPAIATERPLRKSETRSDGTASSSSDSDLDNMLASLEDAETQLNFGSPYVAVRAPEEVVAANRIPPPPLPPPSQSPQSPFLQLVESPAASSHVADPTLKIPQAQEQAQEQEQEQEGLEEDFWAAELERSNLNLDCPLDLEDAQRASKRPQRGRKGIRS
mmetsp:Transcript_81170/g.178373  ORF Transcript_81170/g.178373 Transcript_81170/m.178373 type:complete len:334 (+) Transcript_81170:218-1219(+)